MVKKSDWSGMKLKQPATRWQDALPCGNGMLGALVYGHICNELITLNHEAQWVESPRPQLNSVNQHLKEFRQKVLNGKYQEGLDFFLEKIEKNYKGFDTTDPYQPVCDIKIDMDTKNAFTNYSRLLNFKTGEATVAWEEKDIKYKRKLFVSRANDSVVIRINASVSKKINCSLTLIPSKFEGASGMGSGKNVRSEKLPFSYNVKVENDLVTLQGKYNNGKEFGAMARVIADQGQVNTHKNKICIKNANTLMVIVKLFVNEESQTAFEGLKKEIQKINEDYDVLLAEHIKLHSSLFERMNLNLRGNEDDAGKGLPYNEELLLQAYDGEVDIKLIKKMFDFGRYLLISSSRPGGYPANLQGVWNGDYRPAWSADYHNDENIQMNYWPALPGNLPEMTEPYFDYYESMIEDFKHNAEAIYGCRGILAPIAQSTHGLLYTGPWVAWTAGAGWLAQLFYDYWLFTQDQEFLEKRAVPFLKEVALFYEDFLVEDENGNLIFIPSLSPENKPMNKNSSLVTINATMDVAIAREVLNNLCQACEILNIEEEGIKRWSQILDSLPEYEINDDGAAKEWLYPGLRDNYHHRHQSHIYPLFPGLEVIEENNLELYQAFKIAVEKRLTVGLKSQTGWSFAHMANIYARLGDGNRALECIELLCRSCVGPNLFTYHNDWRSQGLTMFWGHGSKPPFQIDANFGLTAAILEILVYSRPGIIKLLPALPDKWQHGSVEGILCRGGIYVSMEWDMTERKMKVTFIAQSDQEVTIKFPFLPDNIESKKAIISKSEYGNQYRKVKLLARVKNTISLRC